MSSSQSLTQLLPTPNKLPKLYILIRIVDENLSNAWIRVSRDLPSAHAFAQAFMLNKFNYLYTELEVSGITQLPFPSTVFLAIGQRTPHDVQGMGLGLFVTEGEAHDALDEMAQATTKELKRFQVSECRVQIGLDEDDDDFLERLNTAAFDATMAE